VLSPKFEHLANQLQLGGKLDCVDVPGVLTLGQFGTSSALDRNLLACVDDNKFLLDAVQSEPAAVTGVDYETEASFDGSGVLGLGQVAPWLPNVKAQHASGSRLRMKLSIVDASWDTIPAMSRLFEAQRHAQDCLPALCLDDSRIVYKVLRGRITVELTSADSNAFEGKLELLGGAAGLAVSETARTQSSLTLGSKERLVLGVMSKSPKLELADAKHCDGCGARGEICCKTSTQCDDTLSCIDGTCRPKGSPGGPCDGSRCDNGAACVRGICRVSCGAPGLPCCDDGLCSEGLKCQLGQRARREVLVYDKVLEHGGGLFGSDADYEFGAGSCGTGRLRSRFATMKMAGSSSHCDAAHWMSAPEASDCRVRVHMHASSLETLRCSAQVFATEIDPDVPAPRALCR
jgi:hypothetical protein